MATMGHNKIGVSQLALDVSAEIRAQMAKRRLSNRDLAKITGRGPTYVNARINDESEWVLGDIEALCKEWGMTPVQLIRMATESRDEEAAKRETIESALERLYDLAAKRGDTEREQEAFEELP